MEVRNCKGCGRLYNYIGGAYRNLCPECVNKMEDKFIEVKDYIDENKTATMPMIADNCDVKMEQIERWIREERLFFADDSPIGIACENCGITIKSGRFCPSCKAKMTEDLSSAYSSHQAPIEKSKPRNNFASGVKFDGQKMKHV